MCERELDTEERLQHIDPHSSGYNSISFPFSWAAQPGSWGPSLCWDMLLIPASSLQPLWTSSRRGYIIIWHPPTSCERQNSHSIQPLDSQGRPLISSTRCTCYLHKCISFFDSLAGSAVNMQQNLYAIKSTSQSPNNYDDSLSLCQIINWLNFLFGRVLIISRELHRCIKSEIVVSSWGQQSLIDVFWSCDHDNW